MNQMGITTRIYRKSDIAREMSNKLKRKRQKKSLSPHNISLYSYYN